MGAAYGAIGNMADAIRCYEEGIKVNPQSGEIHANLGVVYFAINEKKKAKAHLKEAREIFIKNKDQNAIARIDNYLESKR